MIIRLASTHILLSSLCSADLGNNFMPISVSEGSHLLQTGKSCSQMQVITDLADWCHHYDVTLLQASRIWMCPAWPLLSNKVKPCNEFLIKRTRSSLSSDSPFEQWSRSLKRCMLCQKLYLKCVIKPVKRWNKKLRIWEPVQPHFWYHRWVLAHDTIFNYVARQSFTLTSSLLPLTWSFWQILGLLQAVQWHCIQTKRNLCQLKYVFCSNIFQKMADFFQISVAHNSSFETVS